MLITKKMLLVLTIAVAFVGAGVGALVTHSANNTTATNTSADANPTANQMAKTPEQVAAENSTQFKTSEEKMAYQQGFEDGYTGCANAGLNRPSRAVAANAPVRYSTERSVAYNHVVTTAPRRRTFWQKHRDKLTLTMGTGGGAMLGGLIGGKKGAGIGALAGLGGSALYTYKLRNRRHRY
jgi:hypothetical protein